MSAGLHQSLDKSNDGDNTNSADQQLSSTVDTEIKKVETLPKTTSLKVIQKLPLFRPPTYYYRRRRHHRHDICITKNHMNELRRKAMEAAKQNRIFSIRGCFSSIRQALIARGWVEKLDIHRKNMQSSHTNVKTVCQATFEDIVFNLPNRKSAESREQYLERCERNVMSIFLEHLPIDFLWTNRKEKCDLIDLSRNPRMIVNKFERSPPFTTKEGLCNGLKEFYWHFEQDIAELFFPRCFNVWSSEEMSEFIENFRLTACIAFIRCLIARYRANGIDSVISTTGTIPFSTIQFASKQCFDYMEDCEHNDIDREDTSGTTEADWNIFLERQQWMCNNEGYILADPLDITVGTTLETCFQLIQNIQQFWPQFSLDGYRNLWIVKPASKCCGRGIQLPKDLKQILNIVNPATVKKERYVVQKYIECPLTIHNTKFDIRQWFLITSVQPLIVWMYKECYLRFSSQEYSLSNNHESVHLTNHAIQKKYINGKRDRRLPNENMWDSLSFQAYLREIGRSEMWHERIYPGMRKAIVGALLASQEVMDRRSYAFEIFGADFMISEDFNTWLIEINACPDLAPTTNVTARLCPQYLEDVIKVVIDRRINSKAEVGNFELVYRQNLLPNPVYMGLNLSIKGKSIALKDTAIPNNFRASRPRRNSLKPIASKLQKRVMSTLDVAEYFSKYLDISLSISHPNGCIRGGTPLSSFQPSSNAATKYLDVPLPLSMHAPPPEIRCRIRSRSDPVKTPFNVHSKNFTQQSIPPASAYATKSRHHNCSLLLGQAVGQSYLKCPNQEYTKNKKAFSSTKCLYQPAARWENKNVIDVNNSSSSRLSTNRCASRSLRARESLKIFNNEKHPLINTKSVSKPSTIIVGRHIPTYTFHTRSQVNDDADSERGT